MKINFVTSNVKKALSLEKALSLAGMEHVKVVPQNLDIIEPQCDTVAEVSKHKAFEAYNLLNAPVVVEDGGFCIEALNDFPGVYSKYILTTIGVDGLIKLMDKITNRCATFVSYTTFINEHGTMHQFARQGGEVLVASHVSPVNSPLAWSDLWKIAFIPKYNKCLCEMTADEVNAFYCDKKSHWQCSSLC